ncbi:hypothetical protein VMT65_16275 [Nocardia sp. CDC153]|uniref:hypothetical protein n=1 Tax=Nocardia sp. CDC153 TaxID=3112167 RepID=UPI002DBC0E9C|nr:hypothetical protein [Nocardia sp. CDC153]MEC3954597.1 hypothetical protein [Nocardia sp. CDC153]
MRARYVRGCGVLALLVGLVTGCTSKPVLVPDKTSAVAAAPTNTLPATVMALPGTLAWDFVNTLQPTLAGKVGLAVLPVGGDKVVALGDWSTGPAWSSMKVPLALAALRKNPGNQVAAVNAIEYSDNTAADTLWQSLGTPEVAAQTVQQVLREGGDTETTVPATRARAEYSAFGQAEWSLANQLKFTAKLPCLPQSEVITSLMGKISSTQRWGLGTLDGAVFKGGWGPDTSGNYLVRQLGLLPVDGGQIAIAIAVQPNSGSFDDGTAILTKIATLIGNHLDELRGGTCPAN